MLLVEGVPLQSRQVHVAGEVDAQIGTRGDRPARMLEFLFVHVDGHTAVQEVLEPACMVEVQVPDDDRLDVLNVVAGGLDRVRELLVLAVLGARKHIGQWSPPGLQRVRSGSRNKSLSRSRNGATYDFQILGTTSLVEDAAEAGILNQGSENDQVSSLAFGILVAQRA